MQNDINNIYNKVINEIGRPASRPVKLMFFETPTLCAFIQNKAKDNFESNEIININNFFASNDWLDNTEELHKIESKFGINTIKFQRKICELLEKYIVRFVTDNNPQKIMIIEDYELYNNGFDPIHFLSAYMFEHYLILEKEIPIVWITIGRKEEYDINEYNYYKTDNTSGKKIKITQDNFRSCIFDYKLD